MKRLMFHIVTIVIFASCLLQAQQGKDDGAKIQADPKPIVFFNNFIDPTGQQDYLFFKKTYYRFVNGDFGNDKYKDMIEHMSFNSQTVPKIKINDHKVYIFPMADFGLDHLVGSAKVINFIKAVLDSGKRVIIFGNGFLEKTTDAAVKKFIDTTMGIKDIGRRMVFSNDTIFPYGIYGKNEIEIGLNDYITCNATGYDGTTPYPAAVNYNFFNWFRSKDESKFTTFFYIAAKIDNVWAATDSAVGIRTILKNGARAVLWSIGPENMHFPDKCQRILHSCILWALTNDVDSLGPELDIIPGFSVDMGYAEQGNTKIKTIRLRNKGFDTLNINKIEFENRDSDEIFPVDSKGQNAESYYKTKTFMLKPNGIDSIKFYLKPKEDGATYLRTISLYTDEQALDTTAYGRKRDITFIGYGGKDDYSGSYIEAKNDYINFDSVSLNKSKKIQLEIHNKGTETLNISAIKLVPQDTIYKINNIDLKKFTLAPKTFNTYEIEFKPIALEDYIAVIQVWSDAENSSEEGFIKVLLVGRGVKEPDFVPEIPLPGGNFKITAQPNPANEKAAVTYLYDGELSAGLRLWLADINGKKALDIFNSAIDPGEGTVTFNTAGLAAGTYFIIAETHGKSAKIPLVIVR